MYMDNQTSYQKQAAPLQSMVKQFDGGAFSNPMMNGMQSYSNPLVPQAGQAGGTNFNPMELFWWLKNSQMLGQGEEKGVAPSRTQSYFASAYGIDGDVYELSVTAESPLVGMAVGEAEAQRDAPLFLALLSGNEARLAPPADQMIWVGSVLGVMGPREAIQDYAQKNLLKMSARLRHFSDLFNPSRSGISGQK